MNELERTPETVGAEIRGLTVQAKQMTLWFGIEIGRRLCPEEGRRKENDMCRTTCMETIAQAARERREARLREMLNTNYGNEPTAVVRYGK